MTGVTDDPATWPQDFQPVAATTDQPPTQGEIEWLVEDLREHHKFRWTAPMKPGVKGLYQAVPLSLITRAMDALLALQAKVQRYRARLEVDHYWQLIGDETVRVELPEDTFPDGIECRDETIRLLEAQVQRGEEERDLWRGQVGEWIVECDKVGRELDSAEASAQAAEQERDEAKAELDRTITTMERLADTRQQTRQVAETTLAAERVDKAHAAELLQAYVAQCNAEWKTERDAHLVAEARLASLREEVEPLARVFANFPTVFHDETVLRLVYDDFEWGDNTVLTEWFVRAFRKAYEAFSRLTQETRQTEGEP